MLLEPSKIPRRDGGYARRWFTDEDMDLYLWLDSAGEIRRLQLCYDKLGDERVLWWAEGQGFRHDRIDSGEGVPGKARSPVLVMDGHCDTRALLARFRAASLSLDDALFDKVYRRLLAFTYRA